MSVELLTRDCQLSAPGTDREFTSAGLLTALEGAWTAIRTRHPEVPAVVLIVGSGSPKTASQSMKWGHYSVDRWQKGPDQLPEVLVSGEGLRRTPAEVFTTLLHEATHGLADARGIQDTSRQGRWHNKNFAKLAGELGMTTVKDNKLGFSPCTLTDPTAAHYGPQIDAIGQALSAWRHADIHEPKPKPTNNTVTAECDCPRKIRLSASVLEVGPIWCGACESAFLPDEADRDTFTTTHPYPGTSTAGHGDEDQGDQPNEEDDEMDFYDPQGVRFGLPTYPYRLAPRGLGTVRQLRNAQLRPGGQQPVAQILWRRGKRIAYLYDISLALPKRTATPAQRAAIERALTARRTCRTCGQVQTYYIPRRYGECFACRHGGAR